MSAYGVLYAFITLMRPLRVAAAVALSKPTENFLQRLQFRLGCSRGTAIAIQYALSWVAWSGLVTVGVSLASACSGVPVFSY